MILFCIYLIVCFVTPFIIGYFHLFPLEPTEDLQHDQNLFLFQFIILWPLYLPFVLLFGLQLFFKKIMNSSKKLNKDKQLYEDLMSIK